MRTTTKRTLWITATTVVIALPAAAAWAATDDPTESQGASMMDTGSRGSMMEAFAGTGNGDTELACTEHADSAEMKGSRSDTGETMRSHHKRVTAGGAANHMGGAGHRGASGMWDGASD